MEQAFPSEQLRIGKYGLLYAHILKLFNKLNLEPMIDFEGGEHETYSFSRDQVTSISGSLNLTLIDIPGSVTITAEDRVYNYGKYLKGRSYDEEYGWLPEYGPRYNPWGDRTYDINLYSGDIATQYTIAVWFDDAEETTITKSVISSLEAAFTELSPNEQATLLFEHNSEEETHDMVHTMLYPQADPLEDGVRSYEVSDTEYAELVELIRTLKTTV